MPSYYCHQCNRAVLLHEGDFVCSICRSEFIEEIPSRPATATSQSASSPPNRNAAGPSSAAGEAPPRAQAAGENQPDPNINDITRWIESLFTLQRQAANQPPENAGQQGAQRQQHPFEMFFGAEPNGEPNRPISVHVSIGPQGMVVRNGGNASRPGVSLNLPAGSFEDLINGLVPDMFQQFMDQAASAERVIPYTEEQIHRYLPLSNVNKEHVDNAAQCPTCFETLALDTVVGLLDCGHIFHPACIEPWLKNKTSCPVCRQPVDIGKWKRKTEADAEAARLRNDLEDLD